MIKGWYQPPVGFLRVSGRDRQDFLHRLLSCNIKNLTTHRVIPGGLLTAMGRLIAPLWCAILPDGDFLLQTPLDCLESLTNRLERYIFSEDVVLTEQPAQLWQVIGSELELAPGQMRPEAGGYLAQQDDLVFWSLEGSDPPAWFQELGLHSLTFNEAETHRILTGTPAWGAELDESVIPLGLNWDPAFDHNKGCYTGQEVISRLTFVGHPPHQLWGLHINELLQEVPATLQKDGETIGTVTSCVDSQGYGVIGLARVRWQRAQAGDLIQVETAENPVEGRIVTLPFVMEP